jgi:hypothetical protein
MVEPDASNVLDRERLEALLETLLPSNGIWPGALELDLATEVLERVGMAEGHADSIGRLLDALSPDFQTSTQEKREAVLQPLAGTTDFAAALLVAYDAYYVHERVLSLLEERCGYVTRPPQPQGFELEPFDESILARAREREPFWRQA